MSESIEKKFGDVLIDKSGRQKFEYLVRNNPHRLDPAAVFSLAVRSLFKEFALENMVDSDDSWCIISTLHVYSCYTDILDDIQSTHRSHLVKKLNRLVEPLCEEKTHNSLFSSVAAPSEDDFGQISLLEWLMMIEYEDSDTPEFLARQWDYLARYSTKSLVVRSDVNALPGVCEYGPLISWYSKPFDDLFRSDLERKMFNYMAETDRFYGSAEMIACEAVDALFTEFALSSFVVPEETWCLVAMMSVFGILESVLTPKQEMHYMLLIGKLHRLVEPICVQETRHSPACCTAGFPLSEFHDLYGWLCRVSLEESDNPSSLAAYWDRIVGDGYQYVPKRFRVFHFPGDCEVKTKMPSMSRAQPVR